MYRIGIDLGGTNIAAGVVDESHHIVAEASVPTGAERAPEAVVADICRAAELAMEKAGITAAHCASIGIGSPGTCDSSRGVVVRAYNLGWFDVPVCDMVTQRLGLPCRLSNDANCAALAETVAGAAVGEERDVKVTFPTEYVPELAGKDAVFRIKVHQITRRTTPEWNDDFARQQGFADVSSLRRAVMESAVQKKQAQAAEQFANALIRQVTEGMTVTIPDAMVENQLDGIINELRSHLQAQGYDLEPYLETCGMTLEQLRDHTREQAAAAARYELAMTEIARREGIDVTEADVDAKYQELSRQYDLSVELLRQQLPPLRLRHDLKLAAAQAVVVNAAKRK